MFTGPTGAKCSSPCNKLPLLLFSSWLHLFVFSSLCVQIFIGEVSMYVMKSTREALLAQEKTIVTGDCCYLNPLIRRIIRFVGKKPVKIQK